VLQFFVAPFVSVIIPTLNRESTLRNVILYFVEQETYLPRELIVVNQTLENEPETEALFKRLDGKFTHARVKFRGGSKARNQGARLAKGEIFVFVDDDVLPLPGFLQAHVEALSHPGVVAVAGPCLWDGQKLRSESELLAEELKILKGPRARILNTSFRHEVWWAPTANFSVRRKDFLAVDGFDENDIPGVSSAGIHDVDFSFRLKALGGALQYAPEARAREQRSSTGGCRDVTGKREFLEGRLCNLFYMWRKHPYPDLLARFLWLIFRKEVFNRPMIMSGQVYSGVWCFLRALFKADRHSRKLLGQPHQTRFPVDADKMHHR